MNPWKQEITAVFTGASLGISRERLDWTGISELQRKWEAASPDERCKARDALVELIREEKTIRLTGASVLTAYILRMRNRFSTIESVEPSCRSK
mgnify:CR=1 FL=1